MHDAARSRPATTALAPAALLTLLAGCVGPFGPHPDDYGDRSIAERIGAVDAFSPPKRADADLPTTFEEVIAIARTRFEGMEAIEMSLEECRAAAIENNLDLRVALIDPVIAAETLREEEARFEAVFTPSIRYTDEDRPTFQTTVPEQQDVLTASLGVSVPMRTGGRITVDLTQQRRETANPFVTLSTAYSSALRASLSHPLLRGAGRRANTHAIRVAAYQSDIAGARTQLEIIRQLAQTERAYWRLYAARQELDVRQQQYELAEAQLRRAQRRVDAGDAPEVEVIRAEAGLAERLEAIIIAENLVLARQRELKRLINVPGLEMETRIMIEPATEPDPVLYELDASRLTLMAEDNRMELLELELQLAADQSAIQFARNQALPGVDMDFSYTIAGLGEGFTEANRVMRDAEFGTWSLGFTGDIPIGNEAARARVQRAILTRLQRLGTRESRRLIIHEEVLGATDQAEAGWQRILAARQAVIAAARALEAEQRQFDVGARTSTDVLDAATRLAEAQSAEIRAMADYQIALVDLAVATGTLLGAARIEWEPLDPRQTAR